MNQSLRDLLISVKFKIDKSGIQASDTALKETTASASTLEKMLLKVAAAHKKIKAAGAQADEGFAKMLGFGTKSRPVAPRKDAPKIDNSELLAATFAKPKTAFEQLRESAKAAMASVGAGMKAASDKVDTFAVKVFSARNAMAGFTAVIVARAISTFIGDVIDSASALSDMSARTRVSVETLQAWKALAADTGVEFGALESSFRKLSKSMKAASKDGSPQAKAFKDLGVEAQNASKTGLRAVEDVMLDVGVALNQMEDDALASAVALQLMGPAGASMVPAFVNGAEATRKYLAAAKDAASMSQAEADQLNEVGDAAGRAKLYLNGLKDRAVMALTPALEWLVDVTEKASKWLLHLAKETKIFETLLGALATGGLWKIAMMFGSWVTKVGGARAALALLGNGLRTAAGFALRFILPLLIIEDFLTFLSGGKSLFGRAFNEIFGEGGAQKVRDGLLNAFTEMKEVIGQLGSAISDIGVSDLFKGAAKSALDAILLVLNAIGAALNDDTDKAIAFAEALERRKEKFAQDATGHKVGDEAPTMQSSKPTSWVEKVPGFQWLKGKVQSDPTVAAEYARNNFTNASSPLPSAPAAASSSSRSVTLNDQRKIEVNVSGGDSPGAVGRAVSGAVSSELQIDQRQVMSGISE